MQADDEYGRGALEVLASEDHFMYGERTKSARLSIAGPKLTYDVSEGVPFLTQKYVKPDLVIPELLWFLKGDTNIQYLEKNDVGIWTANAFQNYVEKKGFDLDQSSPDWKKRLREFKERIREDDAFAQEHGDLGKVYGAMWREFPGPNGDVDQLQPIIEDLREDKQSTRHVVSAWHPAYVDEVALPPCHYTFQFHNKGNGELDLTLTQRSTDTFLGEPFNIASYGLLMHIVAKDTGLKPGQLHHFHGNKHIYVGAGQRGEWYVDEENRAWLRDSVQQIRRSGDREQFAGLEERLNELLPAESEAMQDSDHVPKILRQVSRPTHDTPIVQFSRKTFDEYEPEDFTVVEYDHEPYIRGTMAV